MVLSNTMLLQSYTYNIIIGSIILYLQYGNDVSLNLYIFREFFPLFLR